MIGSITPRYRICVTNRNSLKTVLASLESILNLIHRTRNSPVGSTRMLWQSVTVSRVIVCNRKAAIIKWFIWTARRLRNVSR